MKIPLPKKIVAIGSSTFYGRIDPKGGGFIGRLKTYHEEKDPHNALYNLGISGDTTGGMLKRLFPEASLRKPDLLILTSGSNDTRRLGSKDAPVTTDIGQFSENIKQLIKQGRTLANVVFVGIYPIDEGKTAPLTYWNDNYYYLLEDAKNYAQAVKEICKQENIPYLDIFNEWIKEDYKKYLFEDGLHANETGHQIIFEKLREFLETIHDN